MKAIDNMVSDLRGLKDKAAVVKKLQEIEKTILTEYTIKVGDTEIEPLLVEAYYCVEEFKDENSHQRPGQMDHAGCLYFHEKGYGGVDICLSDGNYYFSVLLKCTKIGDVICTQTTLYDTLKRYQDEAKGKDVKFELKNRKLPRKDPVIYVPRKNLQKETMKCERIGAVLKDAILCESVKRSLQEGKIKTIARYFLQYGIEPSDENIVKELGYRSKEIKEYYQDFKENENCRV